MMRAYWIDVSQHCRHGWVRELACGRSTCRQDYAPISGASSLDGAQSRRCLVTDPSQPEENFPDERTTAPFVLSADALRSRPELCSCCGLASPPVHRPIEEVGPLLRPALASMACRFGSPLLALTLRRRALQARVVACLQTLMALSAPLIVLASYNLAAQVAGWAGFQTIG